MFYTFGHFKRQNYFNNLCQFKVCEENLFSFGQQLLMKLKIHQNGNLNGYSKPWFLSEKKYIKFLVV